MTIDYFFQVLPPDTDWLSYRAKWSLRRGNCTIVWHRALSLGMLTGIMSLQIPANAAKRVAQTSPRTLVFTLMMCLTSLAPAADDNVELLDQWPNCEFERLGVVESKDGREIGAAGGGSKRANEKRATRNILRKAAKLDAHALVLTQRKIQRDGSKARFVHLIGVAIGPCSDG